MEYELGANAIFDTLKCAACGNKDFTERQKSRDGNIKYVYVCQNCGHIMAFENKLKSPSPFTAHIILIAVNQ